MLHVVQGQVPSFQIEGRDKSDRFAKVSKIGFNFCLNVKILIVITKTIT